MQELTNQLTNGGVWDPPPTDRRVVAVVCDASRPWPTLMAAGIIGAVRVGLRRSDPSLVSRTCKEDPSASAVLCLLGPRGRLCPVIYHCA